MATADAPRQFLEGIFETQSPDPPAEGNLPVGGEPDEVKHLLADVDADKHRGLHGCFSCSTLLAVKG
jgi:hypothetical protein